MVREWSFDERGNQHLAIIATCMTSSEQGLPLFWAAEQVLNGPCAIAEDVVAQTQGDMEPCHRK